MQKYPIAIQYFRTNLSIFKVFLLNGYIKFLPFFSKLLEMDMIYKTHIKVVLLTNRSQFEEGSIFWNCSFQLLVREIDHGKKLYKQGLIEF